MGQRWPPHLRNLLLPEERPGEKDQELLLHLHDKVVDCPPATTRIHSIYSSSGRGDLLWGMKSLRSSSCTARRWVVTAAIGPPARASSPSGPSAERPCLTLSIWCYHWRFFWLLQLLPLGCCCHGRR